MTHHLDNLGVYWLSDHPALRGNIVKHFMQRCGLDLLALELSAGVIKIEHNRALMQLFNK